jgi:hypothetical protein
MDKDDYFESGTVAFSAMCHDLGIVPSGPTARKFCEAIWGYVKAERERAAVMVANLAIGQRDRPVGDLVELMVREIRG